jgi:hypothetical protein
MSTAASIFVFVPVPLPDATKVIETVGVEVVDHSPHSVSNDSPANGNGLIPFASTLRRVDAHENRRAHQNRREESQ